MLFGFRNRSLITGLALFLVAAPLARSVLAAPPAPAPAAKALKKKRLSLPLPEKLPSAGRLRLQMDYPGASWDWNLDGHKIPELLVRAIARGWYRRGTSGTLERDLVESELASTDASLWTFRFRTDVRWSDGTPFKAEHAAAGLLRAAKTLSNEPPEAVKRIQGYAALRSLSASVLTGVTVESEHVLRIQLVEPDPEFALKLLDPRTFPARPDLAKMYLDYGFNIAHTAYLGRWMVTESNPTIRAKLRQNPEFRDGPAPAFQELELWFVPDSIAAANLYARNHLDALLGPIQDVRADGVVTTPRTSLVWLRRGSGFEARCHSECMKALSHAIDRTKFDRLRPATSWVPPELWDLQQLGTYPEQASIMPPAEASPKRRSHKVRVIQIGIPSDQSAADLQLLKETAKSVSKSLQKYLGVTCSIRIVRENGSNEPDLMLQLTDARDGAIDSFLVQVQGRKSSAQWKTWSKHEPRSRERILEFIAITRRELIDSAQIIPLGWGLHFRRMKPYLRQLPLEPQANP